MPADMKETIAEAVLSLLIEQHVKKLTVKDIVEQCHITRQAFYYHFEDIPELFRWILEKRTEKMLRETLSRGNSEEGLRCFFVAAINSLPYVKRGMDSNYRPELEQLLRRYAKRFFAVVIENQNLYSQCSAAEIKVIIRYHSMAVFGLLQEWTEQDTEQLDQIIHTVYRLITEGIPPHWGGGTLDRNPGV